MASEILPITAQSFKSIKVTPHTALKISVCVKERDEQKLLLIGWLQDEGDPVLPDEPAEVPL